ncbi:MAG: flagellar hook capping FlgD N-terminal domain-containing protein [Pseudomonadota bacterium]
MSDINNVVSVNTGGQIAGEGSGALAKLNEDFDSFLTLLTTQLRNQDPTDPVDTTEFTNQLVQFASVEQLIGQTEVLNDLLTAQQDALRFNAASYIGTRVEVPSAQSDLIDGQTRWSYTLPREADSVILQVVDSSDGSVVNSYLGETSAQTHTVVWTGEASDGSTAPDGRYFLRVSAADGDGDPITTSIKSLGQVTGVALEEGADPALIVFGQPFSLAQVSAVTL